MVISSIGVVTSGCKDCEKLRNSMSEAFSKHGISLSFVSIDYMSDPDYATELSVENGFDDIPAYEVAGVVFKKGFDESLVREALDKIG